LLWRNRTAILTPKESHLFGAIGQPTRLGVGVIFGMLAAQTVLVLIRREGPQDGAAIRGGFYFVVGGSAGGSDGAGVAST
jgi:hypothetical protein